MMVPTTHLDLSVSLFGERMFAPVMAGPVSRLQDYHRDGEVGVARAASNAKAWMVVSSESSMPLEKVAAESKTVLWYQVYLDADAAAVRVKIDQAVKNGCKAICISPGVAFRNGQAKSGPAKLAAIARPAIDWEMIDELRKDTKVLVLLKGIMSPQEAQAAAKRGIEYRGFELRRVADARRGGPDGNAAFDCRRRRESADSDRRELSPRLGRF
jgi:4-hydroxymandelate oxidase